MYLYGLSAHLSVLSGVLRSTIPKLHSLPAAVQKRSTVIQKSQTAQFCRQLRMIQRNLSILQKNDDDSYTVCLGDSDQLFDFFSLDFTNTSKLEAYIEKYKDVKPTYYRFQNTEQILRVHNQLSSVVAPLCNNYSLSFNFTFFYDKPYYDSYDNLEIIDMETTYIWTNESRSKSYGFSLGKKIDDNDNYVDYKKRHTGYEPELLYQTEDQKIQVYTATLPEELTKKAVWYTIVVDRQIIGRSYRDLDAESVRDYPIELLLENIEFLPFEDVKWSDIIH